MGEWHSERLSLPICHGWRATVVMTVVMVTCGHWDLQTMLPSDLKANNLSYPDSVYKRWVNIKQAFSAVYCPVRGRSFLQMMKHTKLDVEGRHHSGIDDSRNIARLFGKLVEVGLTQDQFLRLVNDLREWDWLECCQCLPTVCLLSPPCVYVSLLSVLCEIEK